ncbi:macro domain-containing protein [Paenibacillus sp. UMB4589-SE434]|uniref:macro domain-containing protein n=1 Tax=Paenibacillus sp. UMB4589-SE434 TaxID=3046314 RepID=UPI00254BB04B|nr:macro domain-containing protein [Paenibacillus sp. UMB4589-SE434]MDK8180610.1 macro domain-containing protein [Paenibacillus sp. UMB4589-SE434]
MAVYIVEGDLLKATEDIIGHQVNCQGVMGSGIAKSLRAAYSNLYPMYKEFCSKHQSPSQLLGKCQIINTGSNEVANLYGQLNYGRQKTVYTNYEALKAALETLRDYAVLNNLSVALPYNIGCGLANGDWDAVSSILSEVFMEYEVTLYRFK